MFEIFRMMQGSKQRPEHPAPTGGDRPPGQEKAPHVVDDAIDTERMNRMGPLLGIMAFMLGVVTMIVLFGATGNGALPFAFAFMVSGALWVVRLVLRMTSDDEPEPTARGAERDRELDEADRREQREDAVPRLDVVRPAITV